MEFKTITKNDRESLVKAIAYGNIYREFRVEPDEKGTARVVAYFNSGSIQTVIANANTDEANYLINRAYEIKWDAALNKYSELL